MLNAKGKKILKSSYSVLQDDFFHFMRAAGYTDVERGEHGSTEEHLTVTQFKIQAEQQRLEAVTGQVAQAEQRLADAKAATEKQKKKLEALQKETKSAKTIALTVQDIEAMGKKNALTGNVSFTQDQCETLKRYAVNGIIANADNQRLKEKLASAEKTVSIWKQRYDVLHEKYQELKKKPSPIWMHWKLHLRGFGLFLMPSSPEERKPRNTNSLTTSVGRTWNTKRKEYFCL